MGLFDALRRKRAPEDEQGAGVEEAQAPAPSIDLTEAAAAPATPAAGPSNPFDMQAHDTGRMYNPYEGLGMALNRREGLPSFRLPEQPEFLFSEEATVHHRSFSENVTYYTGAGYLAGALLGGGRGAFQALSSPLAVEGAGATQRLRVNQLLNTSGKLGRANGNSLGTLGLFFAAAESLGGYLNDGEVVPPELCTLAAGATTGALYRSVRGPRQAAAAGALGLLGAGILVVARKTISSGL